MDYPTAKCVLSNRRKSDDTDAVENAEKMIGSSAALHLINVGLPRAFVDRGEESVDLRLFRQPRSHPAKLLAETIDGLHIHVGLRDELRH